MRDSLFNTDSGSSSSSSLSRCSLHRRLASSAVPKKPPLLLPDLSASPMSSCRDVPSACALSSANALRQHFEHGESSQVFQNQADQEIPQWPATLNKDVMFPCMCLQLPTGSFCNWSVLTAAALGIVNSSSRSGRDAAQALRISEQEHCLQLLLLKSFFGACL
jgi:hypothetical protein